MAFMTIPMIAGLAISAAGAAANFASQRAQQQQREDIQNRARAQVARNEREAQAILQRATHKAGPEGQQQKLGAELAKIQKAQASVTEGTPADANIIKMTADTPKVVSTEAAKQLGTELDKAKQQMASSAQLSAWNQLPGLVGIDLSKSGGKIAQLGDFSTGTTNAAVQDAAQVGQGGFPIGDLLQGVGGSLIGGAGPSGWATNMMTPTAGKVARLSGPMSGIQSGDLSAIF
jgi:hypothetical protein